MPRERLIALLTPLLACALAATAFVAELELRLHRLGYTS